LGDSLKITPSESVEVRRSDSELLEVEGTWGAGGEPARAVWQTRPGGRTEQWFRDIDRLHREGRVRDDGMPGPLAFAVLLTEYEDVSRLAVPAEPVVRAALSVLAVAGRARGYRAAA
jgi:hypothetical protein